MPSAFVWGGLKAVIEVRSFYNCVIHNVGSISSSISQCFGRYNELFDKLESQMKKLEQEMKRLSAYEKLF